MISFDLCSQATAVHVLLGLILCHPVRTRTLAEAALRVLISQSRLIPDGSFL
jgi:hypothetical protein